MAHLKFDMSKLERLNDPARFESLPPEVFWRALGFPVGTIVEVGAGTGLFASAFAALAPEATIYAADMAPQMIEWMREHRSEVACGRIVPVLAAESSVPLPDATADAVYMVNLHHELADPAASYAEARRLLKPGGHLLVVDWAARETPKGPPPEIRVTGDELRILLEAAGFAAVCIDESTLPWHLMATATRREVDE